jgi:ABC-type branched-subunit amino acid transport system permease subunit
MLFFAPIVVAGLALFLRWGRYGVALRAAAGNPEAARMAGIWSGRMSSLAWAFAGAISTFTAVLVLPSRGFTPGEAFGPSLLLRALAVAVLARMVSLPVALAGGVGLGVVEQLLLWNYPRSGFVEVVLFIVILVGLLVQPSIGGRDEPKGSWAAVQAWRPLPEAFRRVWLVRNGSWIGGLAVLAVAMLLPMRMANSTSVIMIGIMGFAMVGLSVGILTGLAGQLSLGQFAVAGIGALVSYQVSSRTGNFPLAFTYAALAGAAASLIIGLPALRLRGLMLTVTTLSFALVTPSWLLKPRWALSDGHDPGRPIVRGHPLDTGRSY